MSGNTDDEIKQLRDEVDDEIYRMLLEALEHQWARAEFAKLLRDHVSIIVSEVVESALRGVRTGEHIKAHHLSNVSRAIAENLRQEIRKLEHKLDTVERRQNALGDDLLRSVKLEVQSTIRQELGHVEYSVPQRTNDYGLSEIEEEPNKRFGDGPPKLRDSGGSQRSWLTKLNNWLGSYGAKPLIAALELIVLVALVVGVVYLFASDGDQRAPIAIGTGVTNGSALGDSTSNVEDRSSKASANSDQQQVKPQAKGNAAELGQIQTAPVEKITDNQDAEKSEHAASAFRNFLSVYREDLKDREYIFDNRSVVFKNLVNCFIIKYNDIIKMITIKNASYSKPCIELLGERPQDKEGVRLIQAALKEIGVPEKCMDHAGWDRNISIDGEYGKKTSEAIADFANCYDVPVAGRGDAILYQAVDELRKFKKQ